MAVISDGNPYGVADGLIYSFPVVCSDGKWSIVPGLPINQFSQEKLDATAQELLEEKQLAHEILGA